MELKAEVWFYLVILCTCILPESCLLRLTLWEKVHLRWTWVCCELILCNSMHPLVFGTKLTHLLYCVYFTVYCVYYTLKKKSSYIRKFRRDRLQSHIWLTASSHMVKYLRISSYIRKLFLIYDFATVPIWISLHMMKILLSFLSVHRVLCVLNRILCVLYRVLCVLYRVLCLLYQSTLHWPGVRQLEDGTGSWSWVQS